MKIAILAITNRGKKLADSLNKAIPDTVVISQTTGVKDTLVQIWEDYDAIICIMAAGIVVRCIAGLCHSKYEDPCVLVVDEKCHHIISLLSGHIGGGNALAHKVAEVSGGTAIISTASDVSGHTAVDLWTVEHNLVITNYDTMASVSARLLNNGHLTVYQEKPFVQRLPSDFRISDNRDTADITISFTPSGDSEKLELVPRINFIGFGCRRGATVEEFKEAIDDLQRRYGLDLRTVAGIASIDLKNDEFGLLEIARLYKWPIRFYSKEILNEIVHQTKSKKVFEKIGAHGVSEPAAIKAATFKGKSGRLIIGKVKWKKITAAVAQKES